MRSRILAADCGMHSVHSQYPEGIRVVEADRGPNSQRGRWCQRHRSYLWQCWRASCSALCGRAFILVQLGREMSSGIRLLGTGQGRAPGRPSGVLPGWGDTEGLCAWWLGRPRRCPHTPRQSDSQGLTVGRLARRSRDALASWLSVDSDGPAATSSSSTLRAPPSAKQRPIDCAASVPGRAQRAPANAGLFLPHAIQMLVGPNQ
jgi:hypothetical protein